MITLQITDPTGNTLREHQIEEKRVASARYKDRQSIFGFHPKTKKITEAVSNGHLSLKIFPPDTKAEKAKEQKFLEKLKKVRQDSTKEILRIIMPYEAYDGTDRTRIFVFNEKVFPAFDIKGDIGISYTIRGYVR